MVRHEARRSMPHDVRMWRRESIGNTRLPHPEVSGVVDIVDRKASNLLRLDDNACVDDRGRGGGRETTRNVPVK